MDKTAWHFTLNTTIFTDLFSTVIRSPSKRHRGRVRLNKRHGKRRDDVTAARFRHYAWSPFEEGRVQDKPVNEGRVHTVMPLSGMMNAIVL